MGLTLIAYLFLPLIVLHFVIHIWHKRNGEERRRALDSALKAYARGITVDDEDLRRID